MLFFVDAIGLRPHIERMADRIASWGYIVLPHVFHREGTSADLAPRGDLRDPGERKAFFPDAMPLVQRLTPEVPARDLPAYVPALRSRPEVAGAGARGHRLLHGRADRRPGGRARR